MDKELQKLWDKVVAASQKAKAAGDRLSADDINDYLQKESGGKYSISDVNSVSLRNVARSFAQGVTMNFGDEMLGAVAGDKQKEDMRLRDEMFQQAHPYAAGAAELAGGVAPFLIPGIGEAAAAAKAGEGVGAVSKAALLGKDVAETSIRKLMMRGAATGAVTGSVAGAGAGEDAASRTQGAVTGGVLGGVVGAAIPAAAGAVGYIRGGTRPVDRILRAHVANSGGAEALSTEAARYAAAGKGGDVMMADLSPELRGLAELSATASPRAKDIVEKAVQARQATQTSRLLADLETHTPGLPKDATSFGKQVHKASMDWASGAYDDLRANYQRVDNTILERPQLPPEGKKLKGLMQSALDQGVPESHPLIRQMRQQLHDMLPPLSRAEDDFLQTLEQPFARDALRRAQIQTEVGTMLQARDQPSFEKLFTIKELVEDAANKAWGKDGQQGLGKRLRTLQNMLDGHLVDNIPEYSAVTQEYAQRMNLERHIDLGVAGWGDRDSAGLKAMVDKMSPSELFAYRSGMASELSGKLRNTATNQDAAKRILDASIASDEKLGVIFGDQQTFNKFLEKAKLEANMAKLRGSYGGSPTAAREALKRSDPTDLALSLGSHSMAVPGANYLKAALSRFMAAATRSSLQREHADALAPLLTARGTPAIDALLQRILNPAPIVGTSATMAAPAAAGAMAAQVTRPQP